MTLRFSRPTHKGGCQPPWLAVCLSLRSVTRSRALLRVLGAPAWSFVTAHLPCCGISSKSAQSKAANAPPPFLPLFGRPGRRLQLRGGRLCAEASAYGRGF